MWEWISRLLIPLASLVGIFCFIIAAFKAPTDYGKAACIVAAIAGVIQLTKFEIKN